MAFVRVGTQADVGWNADLDRLSQAVHTLRGAVEEKKSQDQRFRKNFADDMDALEQRCLSIFGRPQRESRHGSRRLSTGGPASLAAAAACRRDLHLRSLGKQSSPADEVLARREKVSMTMKSDRQRLERRLSAEDVDQFRDEVSKSVRQRSTWLRRIHVFVEEPSSSWGARFFRLTVMFYCLIGVGGQLASTSEVSGEEGEDAFGVHERVAAVLFFPGGGNSFYDRPQAQPRFSD
mmetsp:Transcript_92180/g.211068  ORF Transcript_92180/g.211068 Transcript_92180/m.211068 type:complete len:235 (-) Transcript_92180:871-1575(-)